MFGFKANKNVDEKVETIDNNPHDLYLSFDDKKIKMGSQISSIYGTEEYYTTCILKRGTVINFKRYNDSFVPVREQSNCGYTLVGKAKQLFKANKALVAYGEPSDDQEYVYINNNSEIQYVGETSEHTIYVRVYDNASGERNDRWVVISII